MRNLLLSIALASAITAGAQPFQRPEPPKQTHQLSVGDLTLGIDAERGGKILSFKYKDQEILSQSRWPESFGSTFWTSPQKEWNWPPVQEIDKGRYRVEHDSATRLIISSEVSEKLGFRVVKDISTDAGIKAFVVKYSIINESDQTRQVAPWEITRVKNEGVIFFEANADNITPAGLMPFTSEGGAVWYQTDEASENRKINADGKGWLAYSANGLLLVKRFEDLSADQPAPDEAEVQVYVNRGKTYIELESQGAYTTLKPGERLSWTVCWYLLPVEATATPENLLQKVNMTK